MYLEPYKSFNILWMSGKVVRQPKKKRHPSWFHPLSSLSQFDRSQVKSCLLFR